MSVRGRLEASAARNKTRRSVRGKGGSRYTKVHLSPIPSGAVDARREHRWWAGCSCLGPRPMATSPSQADPSSGLRLLHAEWAISTDQPSQYLVGNQKRHFSKAPTIGCVARRPVGLVSVYLLRMRVLVSCSCSCKSHIMEGVICLSVCGQSLDGTHALGILSSTRQKRSKSHHEGLNLRHPLDYATEFLMMRYTTLRMLSGATKRWITSRWARLPGDPIEDVTTSSNKVLATSSRILTLILDLQSTRVRPGFTSSFR